MNRTALPTSLVVLALGLAACAPGSSTSEPSASARPASDVKTDAASLGQVTLTLWDQEVRGGGNAQLTKLIAQFQAKYPNIKINRVSRSFDDLNKTLRLALSGNDAPDLVQANNTRSQMGEFVKAKQIIPLDPWMKAYGWDKRYSQALRSVVSYSPDAKTFGSGNLYGLPQVGEVVGLYVDTKKLKALGLEMPKDWAAFESSLATAKAKGEVPLMLGNLDKWPAIHVFGVVQGQDVKPDVIRTLGYGNKGASWKTPENQKAMQTLVDWVDKGYFNNGFNGQGYDPAWQAFTKGQGLYLIGGTWLQADISKAMGNDVTFVVPPPAQAGGTSYTTGASGQPFSITSKAKNPDAAAAFINFITTPEAMKVIAETENLPVVDTKEQKAPNALGQAVFTAFDTTTTSNGLLPYLDWATPTMSDTIGAALQDLLAKKATPDQTLDTLEKDYSAFTAKG
ncbi:extracellular solute-binding protein [Arsenicicoccus piscis]|uniref:Sugar ABC transporter substrate-binding protein n=1 Tax=Arsenicicoccus piscis TaxID=673954 RepID=A0ABQ6HM31_9MICO|nr:extracellular solute-binding protein [Arsenicicoccus piscis]MCH8627020.1 extracellular solute-binding protein [Arsenicicoccus piscis]GMA19052.1 sugar ABC transporter substrate-binding protein [Arsenicicoccus piscis]